MLAKLGTNVYILLNTICVLLSLAAAGIAVYAVIKIKRIRREVIDRRRAKLILQCHEGVDSLEKQKDYELFRQWKEKREADGVFSQWLDQQELGSYELYEKYGRQGLEQRMYYDHYQ